MSIYKIVNDPVHGFIDIPVGLISDLMQHGVVQRLREIRQLGLTNLVYPGACHSRLSHALGAMHLMSEAIDILRKKGVEISTSEKEQALVAILLHDIGHGPFSHALEGHLMRGISHEQISLSLMKFLNREFAGQLSEAIAIFTDTHHKRFLHQLVSSQLDVDRLDYLSRDSFFSGVAEGMIGLERIIKMMSVHENNLVIEEKGIYSVEKFLISRRLMYWQVYLHKTVIAAEQLLMQIIRRARELIRGVGRLDGSSALLFFLSNDVLDTELDNVEILRLFTLVDDADVLSAIKQWQFSEDKILSTLCKMLINRRLPKIQLSSEPIDPEYLAVVRKEFAHRIDIENYEIDYFIQTGVVNNKGYSKTEEDIKILSKHGIISDIYDVSDMLSAKAFSQVTKKYFLCISKI